MQHRMVKKLVKVGERKRLHLPPTRLFEIYSHRGLGGTPQQSDTQAHTPVRCTGKIAQAPVYPDVRR